MKTIISSLIPASTDQSEFQSCTACINLFKSRIRKEDIPDSYKFIAHAVLSYFDETKGGLLDSDIFEILVKSSNLSKEDKVRVLGDFSNFSRQPIPYAKALYSVNTFLSQKESEFIAEKQLLASVALEKGYTDPKTHIRYEGPQGAKLLIQQALYENPYNILTQENPEGDIRQDIDSALASYDARKRGLADAVDGIKSGFDKIDEAIGSFKRGELILIGAATGEGKSQFALNVAYNACTAQGKNGIIFTAETSRDIYRRRAYARHTCNQLFGNPLGLDSNKIRDASLEPAEEAQYLKALDDFHANPSYGYLNICQVTRGATISQIFDKAEEINREHPLDYIIIDYLELLSPERRRQQRREEIEEMLLMSKERALTFANGKGIVVIDLHQIKQEARESVKFEEGKFYTIRDFSHTSEAGKSSDTAIALLYNDELRDAHELGVGFLKIRDGEMPPIFKLFEHFASSYLGNLG